MELRRQLDDLYRLLKLRDHYKDGINSQAWQQPMQIVSDLSEFAEYLSGQPDVRAPLIINERPIQRWYVAVESMKKWINERIAEIESKEAEYDRMLTEKADQ